MIKPLTPPRGAVGGLLFLILISDAAGRLRADCYCWFQGAHPPEPPDLVYVRAPPREALPTLEAVNQERNYVRDLRNESIAFSVIGQTSLMRAFLRRTGMRQEG